MNIIKRLKNYKAKFTIQRFFNKHNTYFKLGDFIIDYMEGNRKAIKYLTELTRPFDVLLYSFPEKLFYNDFRNHLIEIIQLLKEGIINFTWDKKNQKLDENPDIKEAFKWFQENLSQKLFMKYMKEIKQNKKDNLRDKK